MRQTAKEIRSRIVVKMRRLAEPGPDGAMREIAGLMSSFLDAGGGEDEWHRLALACMHTRDYAMKGKQLPVGDAFKIADDEIRSMRHLDA